MNIIAWLIIIGLSLVVLSIVGEKQREAAIEKMFGGRAPLDEGEFYERHFAGSGVPMFVVLGVKRVFEKVLDVDLSRLHPDDSFETDINYFWRDDDWAGYDVLKSCEEEFRVKLSQADFDRMTSFGSTVRVIWGKIQQQQSD